MSDKTTKRLFFALWPDQATRELIHGATRPLVKGAGGRAVPAENFHITLKFLGSVPESSEACVQRAAGNVRGRRFELLLDNFGFWPEPQVAWLGTSDVPDALTALVADLLTELGSCGFEHTSRPFKPHLTLARNVRNPGQFAAPEPLNWAVEDFVLVESTTTPQGATYQIVERWALADPAEPKRAVRRK
ncbi:MAG: RNA 2',3'-cyclic phosphodiesterase [Gammaproteobacteria bacterium]